MIQSLPSGSQQSVSNHLTTDSRFEFGDVALRGTVLFSAAVGVSKPPGQLPFKIPFPTVSDRSG